MFRVGRWVVAVIGGLEAGYFGFAALYAVLYVFAGYLGGAVLALAAGGLAALALAGAAGTLGRRRWGGVLVSAVSGFAFAFLALGGSSAALAAGLATILALGYTLAFWRASGPSPA